MSPLCPKESNSWPLPLLLHPDPQLPHDVTLCASVAFLVHKDVYLGLSMAIPVLNVSFSPLAMSLVHEGGIQNMNLQYHLDQKFLDPLDLPRVETLYL